MNIASTDKEKLKEDVDQLNRQQRTKQSQIEQLEHELEGERARKRTAEREINELNLQISQNKLSGTGKQETSRMQFLREEIAKKQVQISTVQREYRNLLEQRTELAIMGPNQSSPPPRSAGADQGYNLNRLENEMSEIRSMLNDYGLKSKNQNAQRLSDLLRDVEEDVSNIGASFVSGKSNPFGSPEKLIGEQNEDQIQEFVKRSKQDIKEMQEKLETSKRQYKEDKAEVEALRLTDPALYRKKVVVLDKVKDTIEKKIGKLNQRISKIKEIETKNQ